MLGILQVFSYSFLIIQFHVLKSVVYNSNLKKWLQHVSMIDPFALVFIHCFKSCQFYLIYQVDYFRYEAHKKALSLSLGNVRTYSRGGKSKKIISPGQEVISYACLERLFSCYTFKMSISWWTSNIWATLAGRFPMELIRLYSGFKVSISWDHITDYSFVATYHVLSIWWT